MWYSLFNQAPVDGHLGYLQVLTAVNTRMQVSIECMFSCHLGIHLGQGFLCCVVCAQPLSYADSLWPHGLQPTRLLCPWNSPGKNTVVSCHFLLQGIFPTQGLNQSLLGLPALAGGLFIRWIIHQVDYSTTWKALFHSVVHVWLHKVSSCFPERLHHFTFQSLIWEAHALYLCNTWNYQSFRLQELWWVCSCISLWF